MPALQLKVVQRLLILALCSKKKKKIKKMDPVNLESRSWRMLYLPHDVEPAEQ